MTRMHDPMDEAPVGTDDARERSEPSPDVRYLDLDHDGVPDAVERSVTIAVDSTGDGVGDVVDVVRETDAEIGIDGEPHRSEVRHLVLRDRQSRLRRPRATEPVDVLHGRRADGFAVARLRPRTMHEGFEQLGRVAKNLETARVTVARRAMLLEPARHEMTWQTLVALPTRLRRGSPTSVVVPTSELAAALRHAASVHARGVTFVVRPDGLWIGDHEITAVPTSGLATAPRDLPRRPRTVARAVVVPHAPPHDGERTFETRSTSVTTSGALLGALARAAIPKVALVEEEGRVRVVGRRRGGRGRSDLFVLGEAKIHYD